MSSSPPTEARSSSPSTEARSSSPSTEARRSRSTRWRSPAGWSLRARLVATMIALLALLGLAVGASAEIYLHKQLYQRLDAQLDNAAAWAKGPPRGGGNRPIGENRPTGGLGTDFKSRTP